MNFKKFYINGNRYSVVILHRTKTYRISFEGTWNNWMYQLYLFTTLMYIVKEDDSYFSIYRRFYFSNTFIEKWMKTDKFTKKDAQKRASELYSIEREKINKMKKNLISLYGLLQKSGV